MRVAVTGNAASGKTTLSRLWAREGVPVVLADELSREVVEPGSAGLSAVVEAFGQGILLDDGSLDRGALRSLVFRDPESRSRLEAILHPLILRYREEWLRKQASEGAPLVVAEIPLLYEVGLEGEFDLVVVVDAPREVRLRRLVEDRGLSEEDGMAIMEAQLSDEEKRRRADYVVQNAGTREDLETRALALLDLIRARAAGRRGP